MTTDYLEIEDDQNRRNAAALSAANIGVFEFEPRSTRAFWDDRVRELFGAQPDEEIDYEYVISKVHPEDRDGHNDATARALDPKGSGEMDMEYRLVASANQPETWLRARARTLFQNGEAVRLIGTVEDITTRKQAQIRNDVLLRELQHRLTNTLAVVGSVVQMSKSRYTSLDDYADALSGRVHALAQAQELLRSSDWQSVYLSKICDRILASMVGTTHQVRSAWGNDFLVPEQYVLTSSMAIYELATNSIKYGALGHEGGQVTLSVTDDGGSRRFEWRESGGPPTDPGAFSLSGFGGLLLCRIWPQELGGTAQYGADADGAVYRLDLE